MADEPPPPESTGTNSAPGDMGANGVRPWERAWNLDEMRKGAGNWSLAGDAGLLQYLQEFSQKMISRTHEIEKEVANLVHESKLSSVRVNNVFNEFMMLADTQFVENRVYDEDVSHEETLQEEKKSENQEKTREQREKDLIPKVTEAVRLGVEVIEKAFEKLDPNVDDSETDDEDESYRVDPILEAKDPYLERVLPYLIGTPNFMQDDNIGLKDISDDESDDGSLSESESESDEDMEDEKKATKHDSDYTYSDSESDSDTEKIKPPGPKMSQGRTSDSDSDGDLFSTKKSDTESDSGESDDEDGETEKPTKPAPPVDFAAELANKLGGAPPKPPSPIQGVDDDTDEDTKPKRKSKDKKTKKEDKKKTKKEHEEPDPFGDGEESDDDLFGSKGVFKKTSGKLFDEDDDEGDLFGTVEDTVKADSEEEKEPEQPPKQKGRSRTRTSSGKKPPVGGVSMFGGATKPAATKGLFDDDDDEEDDGIFGSMPKKVSEPNQNKPNLFPEEDDDDDGDVGSKPEPEHVKKTEKKKHFPAGAVPMFGPPGAANPLAAAIKKKRQDSDDEDDNDWSDGEKSRSGSLKSNQSSASKQSAKISQSQSKDSLFAGEPDDDAFTTKPKSNSISKNAKVTKGLFDEDDEDDLFGSKTQPAKPPAQTKEKKHRAPSLFVDDDDDDGDLFGSSSTPTPKQPEKKKPPAGAVSMFPGGMDPFGKKKEPEPKKEEQKKEEPRKVEPVTRPPSKSISLFGDDAEEEDLFGSAPPKAAPPKQTQSEGKKNIFDDDGDGDLFGGAGSGDIFNKPAAQPSSQPRKSETTTSVTKVTKPIVTRPTMGSSLFGSVDDDDDENDFFSAAAPKSTARVDVSGVTTDESADDARQQESKKPESPTEVKPKKPVGGVSMFGGMDPFGGLKKKTPEPEVTSTGDDDDDDLFSKPVKKPEVKKVTVPVQSKITEKPTPVAKGPMDDDDDDDDLFSKPVKKPEVKKMNIPVHKISEQPAPVTKGPMDDDEDDDDLFGSKPTKNVEEPKPPESPTEVKPRKPVGGVSMFGGMDPFGELKKKTPERQATSPDPSSQDDELFGKTDEKPKVLEQKRSDGMESKPASQSPPKGKIGRLQAGLNFNPAAMLPGAAPPIKEPEPISIGFDMPAEARTLQSANKDRAKIQTKRRPPSRLARRSAVIQSPTSPTDDFFTSPVSPVSVTEPARVPPPVLEDDPPRVPSPVTVPASKPKTDLFGNDDLFGSELPKPSARIHQSKETNSEKSSPDDIFSTDSFGGAKAKVKNDNFDDLFSPNPKLETKTKESVESKNDDDIFNAVPKKSEGKKNKPPVDVIVDDEDDNIFAKKKSKSKPKPSPIIDDDDDDLFASPALSKPKDSGKSKQTPVEKTALPGENDDDIFADSSTNKKKEIPKKEQPKEEDDDIFNAPKKEEKKKTKKAVTKDEDLFADTTDIFSDIPKAKPKEKKTKKKTSTAPKKTIFKDDIDDIFADTAASTKPKEKKKEKKKTAAAKDSSKDKGKSDDIFDDPLLS